MEGKKNTNFNKDASRSTLLPDLLIYSFCIAGILLFLNFFRIDLYRTLTRQAEPIGTITFKYKAAQRRFVDRVLWDRLKKESPVYEGDLIRTAELSEAKITFAGGGTVIDLDENSLIQIHNDHINISEGTVSASSANSPLVLVLGDSRITVETGGVVNAGVNGGDLVLRVMEGAASFSGPGENRTVSAGETLAVDGTGAQVIREPSALFPHPQARFLNPEPGRFNIPFRWSRTNLGPDETVRLEIAEDRSFTRVVFSEDSAGDAAAARLAPGSYFWRLSLAGIEGAGRSFSPLSFRILSAPAPVLITPAEDYRYQFRMKRPSVRFQWTETGEASFYLLEAADNPGMTNPVLSREVQGSSFYFSGLGPGTWYWQVRPVFPPSYEGAPGEASPASFSISQSGSLRTPELLIPQDQGRVDVGQGDVYFSWLPETEARSYRILISADRNLTNPLIDETASDNFYVYRPGRNIIAPGQYYWAVSQIDIEGNNSSLSPARSFTALEGELTQRLVFPPDGYITAAARLPDLRFTWKTNLPLQTRFQISGYSDFSSLLIDEAAGSETFQGRILPEGTWYWRIQAKGPDNAVFETPPRSFTAAPPIPAPVLLAPSLNGRIAVQEGEPTAFSWETAEGAAYYQFKLYYGENRNNPVYENNLVEGTRQSLSMDSYPEGNYYWTVQGFMPETAQSTRRTGLLSEGDFSIRKLHLVSLNYPGNGAAFEGLRAYLEPGTVRWSSVNQVSASRFIFSRNQDFSGTPVAVINNPPGTISLPRLRAGNYYWTIQAETPDGFNISARPRLLRVLPIQPLPDAANRLPTDGTIIGREELRENRNIRFSWDTVPGATAYIFTLENIDTGKTIIQKSPSPETSFVLEDLTLLDVGAFVWRVEAVLINPLRERRADDEILRRGESTGNGFRIDFGLPVTPELRRPGQLYGR